MELGFDWQPKGTTGDGRCGERCGQGREDPITKRFKHFMALAVDPQRGPRGTNATKMTCGIPEKLIVELLTAINEVETIEDKVVLDLCAGFQSLREQVIKMGAKYVSVDVMGARKVQKCEPREVAVVRRQGDKYLSVLQDDLQGSWQWALPSGQQCKSDTSLHSAGVRALRSGVGLGESTWGTWVTAGPGTNALKHKTYYTYDITHSVPEADIESAFGDREEKQSVRKWGWHTAAEILRGKRWTQEDRDYVAKQNR